MDAELHERIAKLEARFDAQDASIERQLEEFRVIDKKLDKLDIELSRYRGVFGGILLAVTAVGTFIKIFGDGIVAYFKP